MASKMDKLRAAQQAKLEKEEQNPTDYSDILDTVVGEEKEAKPETTKSEKEEKKTEAKKDTKSSEKKSTKKKAEKFIKQNNNKAVQKSLYITQALNDQIEELLEEVQKQSPKTTYNMLVNMILEDWFEEN